MINEFFRTINTALEYYRVAGLDFSVTLPADTDTDSLLPSFTTFRWTGDANPVFSFTTAPETWRLSGMRKIDESDTDLGNMVLFSAAELDEERYLIELRGRKDGPVHKMLADSLFGNVRADLDWTSPDAPAILGSMLRIAFSQAVLLHGGISVHASSVALDGKAYLFLGSSGTGKSTHSALWLRTFDGCELVNDDNPALRLENGLVYVYGTPWSGKTPCYRNVSFPLGGIVRLEQAGSNAFTPLEEVNAFVSLLPSCSAVKGNRRLQDCLHDTISEICDKVPVGLLRCLPDAGAAVLCKNGICKNLIQ